MDGRMTRMNGQRIQKLDGGRYKEELEKLNGMSLEEFNSEK
jgi:hypothetical protein